jgi:hypothetical protein
MSLFKAVAGIITMPVDVVADVITLGGALTDKQRPYTAEKARSVMRNIEKTTK